MKQHLLDAALASVNALVEDEIKSGERGRYFRAQKLCSVAATLSNVGCYRVENSVTQRLHSMSSLADDGDVVDDEFTRDEPPENAKDIERELIALYQEMQRHEKSPARQLADLLLVRKRLKEDGFEVPPEADTKIRQLTSAIVCSGDEPLPMLDVPVSTSANEGEAR